LTTTQDRQRAATTVNRLLKQTATHDARRALIDRLVVALGQESHLANFPGLARLMTPDELAAARRYGVDVQLHSHTHRMPVGRTERLRREIRANRAALGRCASGALNHFCYPSGVHEPSALAVLAELGIESATTCEPGMADAGTPRLLLPRFLDADDIPQIAFEAEMSGVLEIARRVRRLFAGRQTRSPALPAGEASKPAA
jgi:peptidoglycan/xylan/chitin deacetylase (PgdA/CDA1 family)